MPEDYQIIYNRLYKRYGPQYWWPADSPLEMMISAILVQNTSWHNASMALANLKPYLKPEILEALATDKLAQLIHSSGFYNIKAKRIKAFLAWLRRYHYNVDWIKQHDQEQLRKELLQLNGIGRETADDILVYALGKPYFIVDAFTRRIFYRLGYDMPRSYDAFRREIEVHVPNDLEMFNEYHALLVRHAKEHCRKEPICEGCPLLDMCEQRSVNQ